MIDQRIIDQILDIPIADVVSNSGVTLKRAGKDLQACCPFHHEKTPSFTVFPKTNTFKCFGCGAGGNVISYVMKKDGLEFVEALKKLGAAHHITIPEKPLTTEQVEAHKKAESMKIVNEWAARWFEENINQKDTPAHQYAIDRFGAEMVALFGLGFAPDDWNALLTAAAANGIKPEKLVAAGLTATSKKTGCDYSFFRNRLMFPIYDRMGRVAGFAGRALSDDKKTPKYLNTPETELYYKGRLLYGLHAAYTSIKQQRNAILVEGYADVIALHGLGFTHTVCSCGTALTTEQINLLKPICDSITIIGDSDSAGQTAMQRNAENIIKEGLACNIVLLPADKKEKHDPASFFKGKTQAAKYMQENTKDYILYYAETESEKITGNNIAQRNKVMQYTCELVSALSESLHSHYIEGLAEIIKPKSIWDKTLKEVIARITKTEKAKVTDIKLPEAVTKEHLEKYRFYEDHSCYKFQSKSGFVTGSNFVMRPLFHIEGENSRRIYHVINEHGHERRVELKQEELINLSKLRLRMESLGNFIFNGSETDLMTLKRYLYEQTQTCKGIDRLGWQPNAGFWAWANGLFVDGEFLKINDLGIVRTPGEESFYLPYFSEMHRQEDGIFVTERKFRHTKNPNPISLYDYAQKLIEVFGDNARVGLCFYFATLFRDIIVKRTNFFPILNLFGQKGAGKTELARSLLRFFFSDKPDSPNYVTATKAGLADHVATYYNTLCHIDEYKNNITDLEKPEFLKGLWDGTGRTRINMDRDKKKETTAVDVGVMLTGQEMPTVDIALFNRLIFLLFSQTTYNDDEKARFNALKEIENRGLTHITHELLKFRKLVEKNYFDVFDEVSAELQNLLKDEIIEDRTFKNWLVPLAAFKTLEKDIRLPFTYAQCLQQFAAGIIRQNEETLQSNEVAGFWRMFEFLTKNGNLQEEFDFRIEIVMQLKTDKVDCVYSTPKKVLFIDHTRVFQLYQTESKKAGERTIPGKSLEHYLKTSAPYLGRKSSMAFKYRDPVTRSEVTSFDSEMQLKKYRTTTSFAFLYDDLDINIETTLGDKDMYDSSHLPENPLKDETINRIF